MKFNPTPLPGNFTIDLELKGDERGFFARAFCEKEFAAAGLETRFVQATSAFTKKKGTFRGFHYQLPPSAEVKVGAGESQVSVLADLHLTAQILQMQGQEARNIGLVLHNQHSARIPPHRVSPSAV